MAKPHCSLSVRNARKGGNRGGLAPDPAIRNFTTADGPRPWASVYEVKAFEHNGRYVQPGTLEPVKRRDAKFLDNCVKFARATE